MGEDASLEATFYSSPHWAPALQARVLDCPVDSAVPPMKSRLVYLVLAALGLGGLGWYAYTNQKNPGSFGLHMNPSRVLMRLHARFLTV
jgi:hypothetical protein